MATVTCPKCQFKLDSNLKACPQCGLSRLTEVRRELPRKLVKTALIPFNVFFIIWLLSALGVFAEIAGNVDPQITTGANTIRPIFILAILIIGNLLLAGFLWFKKPPQTQL